MRMLIMMVQDEAKKIKDGILNAVDYVRQYKDLCLYQFEKGLKRGMNYLLGNNRKHFP